jgi:hypothetical protein
MIPQFPIKGRYRITQGYYDNANNYPEGKHSALDIVPYDERWTIYPADILPIFNGSEIFITDTDPVRGKGVRTRTVVDKKFAEYLTRNNLLPKDIKGTVYLDILYWHCLEVTDKDGTVSQETPIAKVGNTGNVWSQGVPVPDNMKGKPPYPGLHLHLESVLRTENTIFNLDKDPRGRFNPLIIFNYKPMQFKTQNYKGELRIVLQTSTPEQWEALCAVYGVSPETIDETIS